MPYRVDLGAGQHVFIEQMGTDTAVLMASSGAGQQQQSSSRFATGQWTQPPQAFWVDGGRGGLIIQVTAIQGRCFIQVQQGQIAVQSQPSGQLQEVSMTQVNETPAMSMPPMQPMQPMQPMEPMQPMKMGQPMEMGDMSMNADTMEMRMGNMRMGGSASGAGSRQRFCTQCGAPVQPDDKFCGSCGHQLR